MAPGKQKSLAQNFFTKRHLAARIVNESSVSTVDIVYEIGPGKGILTKELGERAKRIIAVEKDHVLYLKLKKKFERIDNVLLHNADFLTFTVREHHYKVFANLPFNITSAVVRKILYAAYPPDEAYLIIQKEAAEKFIGIPKTTQFSVLTKPLFKLRIVRSFRRTDFSPVPKVDIVMLHVQKRSPPLVSPRDLTIYEEFIKYGFGAWKKDLKSNYRHVFSYHQWKRLSHDLEFPIHACPSELRFRQWLGLFEFYRKSVQRFQKKKYR
jgi:23S rRNA (adenine-N6)-dimethyltransferase